MKNAFEKNQNMFEQQIENQNVRGHPGVEHGVSEGQQGPKIDVFGDLFWALFLGVKQPLGEHGA